MGSVMEGLSSHLGIRLRSLSWPISSHCRFGRQSRCFIRRKTGLFLLSYGGISYFLLLLLATGFAIRNGIQNTLGSRPFWVLLGLGYSLWVLDQSIFLYHQFVLHTEVPDNSIADPVLFLHLVPFMAAVATLPTRIHPAPGYIGCFRTFFSFFFSGASFMLTLSFRTSICSPTPLGTLCDLTSFT